MKSVWGVVFMYCTLSRVTNSVKNESKKFKSDSVDTGQATLSSFCSNSVKTTFTQPSIATVNEIVNQQLQHEKNLTLNVFSSSQVYSILLFLLILLLDSCFNLLGDTK